MRAAAGILVAGLAAGWLALAYISASVVLGSRAYGFPWPTALSLLLPLALLTWGTAGTLGGLLACARGLAPTPSKPRLLWGVLLLALLPGTAFGVFIGTFILCDFAPYTKGNLGTLRSAVTIYFGDTDGSYPQDLSALVPKYLNALPMAITAQHGRRSTVRLLDSEASRAGRFTDSGGWAYVNSGADAGKVVVDCTHLDPRGSVWASY